MWGEDSALAYHLNTSLGAETPGEQIFDNGLYENGANYANVSVEGRVSLSLIAIAILGVMAFYVTTRSSQF